MKTKAKWFLLGGLIALLVIPLQACHIGRTPHSLTKVEALVIIQAYGVPYIDQFYEETFGGEIGPVTATGEWEAKYTGKGNWRIQGTVITSSGENCLTIWTFSEESGEIRLSEFNCD
jgi:hypothetical protein